MPQEQEDMIIAMIAHLEECQEIVIKSTAQIQALQKQAKTMQNVAEKVLLGVPAEIRKGAKAGTSEVLQESTKTLVDDLKTFTESLNTAAAEGRASANTLRRSGLLMGAVLLAITVVLVCLIQFVVAPALVRSYAGDLGDTKAKLAAERAALAKLKNETWQLELIEYKDGTRGIILPKGVKVDRSGPLQDGSGRIGIVITP